MIFLVLEKDFFIFHGTKQICVQAFFDFFFKEFGKEGLDLFLVYFHFLKKAWRVSIDRKDFCGQIYYFLIKFLTYKSFPSSFGADLQLYPGSPENYHSLFGVKIFREDEDVWLDIISSARVAESNKKGLIYARAEYNIDYLSDLEQFLSTVVVQECIVDRVQL